MERLPEMREQYRERDRHYDLRRSEVKALRELATFKAIPGRDPRPVLDIDLRRAVNTRLEKIRNIYSRDRKREKEEVAEEFGLHIIRDRIVLPDLRIEYEDRYGDPRSVDLELISSHYRASHIAQKQQAGFTLYSSDGDKAHSRDRELMYEIFSL